jgi:hypothetical protein
MRSEPLPRCRSVLATGTALAATRVDPDGFGSATNCNALTCYLHHHWGRDCRRGAGRHHQVCPGIYDEQVTVSKQVTIRATTVPS